MIFNIYFKKNDDYELRQLVIEENATWNYFKALKLTIESEIDNIRKNILLYSDDVSDISLKKPRHKDREIQKILNKLIHMRKNNMTISSKIDELMTMSEFIMCECGSKMWKTPLNVSYEKFGNKFLIKENVFPEHINYVYLCENCWRALYEKTVLDLQRNIDMRKRLIKEGYNYLPNEYGFWSYNDDSKPVNKPKDLLLGEGCEHNWRRSFDKVKIKDKEYIKIKEVCVKCGKEVCMK